MIVGVGGKCCAGKDTLADILKKAGYEEISVDALGHRALETRRDEVVEEFGPGILAPDHGGEPGASAAEPRIDRKALGRIVFSDEGARKALEAIVHPEMKRLLAEEIAARSATQAGTSTHGEAKIIINAALIFYMQLHTLCDLVIWVEASWFRRFLRARKRGGLSTLDILRRFWTQRHLGPHSYSESVDIHIVKNEGARARLEGRLQSMGLLDR
jgi:dephospho-CoA kinase